MKKVFIDTNVLIYATLEGDPRFRTAFDILTGRGGYGKTFYVSVQNLAEMYPNLTGSKMEIPDSPAVARKKILSIAELPALTVLPVTLEIQREALALCERQAVRKQRYFDMQIAATMICNDIDTILTENAADFEGLPDITAVNPFSGTEE